MEKLYKVVNGKRKEIKGEELSAFLKQRQQDELNKQLAEKNRDKREDIDPTTAIIAQVKYIAELEELPIIPELKDRMEFEQEKLGKSFATKHSKVQLNKNTKRIIQFGEETNEKINEVKQMAKNAKESNDRIAEVLVELNSSLESIKGFMMILPDLNKNVLAIKEQLEDTNNDDSNTNIKI